MASLTLDIWSLVVIRYRQNLPFLLVEVVCKAYIASLIWGVWSALIYVLTDILPEKKHKNMMCKLALFTLVQSGIVFALPIHIFEDGKVVYTYGTSVICVYVFTVGFLCKVGLRYVKGVL